MKKKVGRDEGYYTKDFIHLLGTYHREEHDKELLLLMKACTNRETLTV